MCVVKVYFWSPIGNIRLKLKSCLHVELLQHDINIDMEAKDEHYSPLDLHVEVKVDNLSGFHIELVFLRVDLKVCIGRIEFEIFEAYFRNFESKNGSKLMRKHIIDVWQYCWQNGDVEFLGKHINEALFNFELGSWVFLNWRCESGDAKATS